MLAGALALGGCRAASMSHVATMSVTDIAQSLEASALVTNGREEQAKVAAVDLHRPMRDGARQFDPGRIEHLDSLRSSGDSASRHFQGHGLDYYLYLSVTCHVADGHQVTFARGWITAGDGRTLRTADRLYLAIRTSADWATRATQSSEVVGYVDAAITVDHGAIPPAVSLGGIAPDDELTFSMKRCN